MKEDKIKELDLNPENINGDDSSQEELDLEIPEGMGIDTLIIPTNIKDYNLSEEECEELGLDYPSEEEDDSDDEIPTDDSDDYERYFSSNFDSHNLTRNDNNYQENDERISFSADPTYQDVYLQDIYNTEEFYFLKFMKDKFQEELKNLIRITSKYKYLKSYDISFLEEGDSVFYLKEKEPYMIQYIFSKDEIFICKKDNSAIKFCNLSEIRPYDKVITEFNKNHRIEVYEKLNKIINDKGSNHIEFFSIFCEYFKIEEKVLYNVIPKEYQDKLKKELRHRTNN